MTSGIEALFDICNQSSGAVHAIIHNYFYFVTDVLIATEGERNVPSIIN